MSRTQLVDIGGDTPKRFVLAANDQLRHPSELEIPSGSHVFYPGSEGLVRLASRLTDMGYWLADVDLRDDAWRSSQEDEDLSTIAQRIMRSIRERDFAGIDSALSELASGLVLESIELSDEETSRRVRVSRTGEVATQVSGEGEDYALLRRFLDSVNAIA